MQKNEILDKLREIISKKLTIEEKKINLESSFTKDLGADSLDVIELVMSFEEEFNLKIEEEEVEKMTTVSHVVDYIEKNL